jgi:hypothetical protein
MRETQKTRKDVFSKGQCILAIKFLGLNKICILPGLTGGLMPLFLLERDSKLGLKVVEHKNPSFRQTYFFTRSIKQRGGILRLSNKRNPSYY